MNIAIKVIKNTAKQFVSSLQKESKKASRKAIGRCGLLLRNQARRNLKSSAIKITDSHFGDKLVHGVRTSRVYRQENSFKRNVRITTNRRNKKSGWFRLGWLNAGTNERFQKKKKNKSVGKITARNFYTDAVASFKFKEKYDEIMNKELSKIKK
jgi:hypothetical protein|nr:MAG TPA: hypothetical protein [Caudoviricetes sp.]